MSLNECQTDWLLLLVGGNPLPVYVSALMLANENTQVRLLHSPEEENARNVAELADLLKKAIESTVKCKVDTVDLNFIDREKIRREIEGVLEQIPEGKSVGFNYTGGTKPMVVYSIRNLQKKHDHNIVLSYLNAQDKMLYVEYGFKPIEQYPAKLATPVSLETLLRLHGYKPNDILGYEAKHVDIAKVIMEICQSDEGIAEWRTWLGNELQHNQLPKNYGLLQPFVEVLEEKTEKRPSENAEETTEVITSWRVWLRNQLQNNQLPPKWESFIEMIEEEIEKRSSENAKQTIYWNDKKLISYSKWFIGGWLEDYVFNTIQSLAAPCALHDYRISLKPVSLVGHNTRGNFELDIVAVQNYQLFGISCIASKKENGEVKKHLLEVYVRARQLGGDEARVALVYLGDNPQAVQYEIDRTWLPSNALRVFGRRDLPDLRNCLYRWFK